MRNNGLLVNKWQIISHHPTFASPGIWSQAKEGLNQVGFILWHLRLVCELPVHVIYPQIPSQTPADRGECLANIPDPWPSSQTQAVGKNKSEDPLSQLSRFWLNLLTCGYG